jgi:lipoprotein signal peptidase
MAAFMVIFASAAVIWLYYPPNLEYRAAREPILLCAFMAISLAVFYVLHSSPRGWTFWSAIGLALFLSGVMSNNMARIAYRHEFGICAALGVGIAFVTTSLVGARTPSGILCVCVGAALLYMALLVKYSKKWFSSDKPPAIAPAPEHRA